MKIAIHQNKDIFDHSTTWDKVWIEYCKEEKIDYEVVDCFSNNILEKIKDFDVLLWHFNHFSLQEMKFARSILLSIKKIGIKVFPDHEANWHFDDKIAQSYILQAINAPIPKAWTFYKLKSAVDFYENSCVYPIVAKLKSGSGSNNVQLLKNKGEAIKYAKKMFGKGLNPTPNLLFKTKSNVQTSRNIKNFVARAKRIPDFIESIKKAAEFDNEKGYVYLQEFIPNKGYDLKVVVVKNKLSFLARDVRKGDFRASGGGSISYDKSLITPEIREIAFQISGELGFECMGYDFVVDSRTNSPKIVEISYGFSHLAQMDLGGHWDRSGEWHNEPLNAPEEIIKNMLVENESNV
ncbi:ATP-grasp domain-containing protein [Bacillus weihaiensis]|uniref:ATP-grasp domain-containing protein n=1 Tax=Bacillus weihaiensis TaxID=1547283 RepID=A0A1L3MM74_9BACI|nr:hypothetical protein [Bacillus weihaiensis]APH03458.1 hypothetical protein A9C19_01070 [Bacillus weihaiensis]